MRIGPAVLAVASLLALTGCGRDPEGSGEGNNSTVAATVPEATDENLMQDPQNHAVPIDAPSPAAVQQIPTAFRGRWGMTANDCDPSRDDAKGLMVVEPTTLRFYESRATLASATAPGGDRLSMRLSFTGEGQSWTADQSFTLLDEGRTLVRTENGPAATLRYERCPA